MSHPVHGRVIARVGDRLLIRTIQGDVEIDRAGPARPGDLVELPGDGSAPRVVRAYPRGEYPSPATETGRLGTERLANLRKRAVVVDRIRRFFAERAFIEVETPLLVRSPGLEVHLDAVPAGAGTGEDARWLITSPEYQMKRLLVAGLDRIFAICKCFRAGEHGHHHAGEFTMLEWYRAWSDLDAIFADTEELVATAAIAANRTNLLHIAGAARPVDIEPPWLRMTVAEAMQRFAGVTVRGDENANTLAARVTAAGIDIGTATHWDDVFYCAFVSRVEPELARLDRPVALFDWPAPLAALARRKPDAPVVERFEIYLGGVELANAFGELTCPIEQRERFVNDLREREARGLATYPIDDAFLAALEEGMPPSAGIALGVDRLVMVITGARHIRDVVAFASDEL